MPKRAASDLAAELTNEGPQGLTKHELAIARRYLRRKQQQLDWALAQEVAKKQKEYDDPKKVAERTARWDALERALGGTPR